MLPADIIAEITTNLAALPLESNLTAQILAAVLAPLIRSEKSSAQEELSTVDKSPHRPRKRAGRPRSRTSPRRRKKAKRRAARTTEARERARAALRANPDATVSAVAKLAKVSFGTVINARKDLAKEARKKARRKSKTAETSKTDAKTDRRERAQKWLRDTLAQGPKEIQAVEAAATKAHIDDVLLTQARGDLGVVASRANTGNTLSVQWSLPG